MDCLHTMFEDVRTQLPSLPSLVSDGDARMQWLTGMKQILKAMPPDEAYACCDLLAEDLIRTRYPGLPVGMAYHWLSQHFDLKGGSR